MGVRGRKSAAELTLVQRAAEVLVVKRPDPPEGLSDEAAAEWAAIVNTMAADYFQRPIYPVLEAYCFTAAERRWIDQRIQALKESDDWTVRDYEKLLDKHDNLSRALASLSVRLGIAFATREFKSFGGKKETGGPKPWEKLSR